PPPNAGPTAPPRPAGCGSGAPPRECAARRAQGDSAKLGGRTPTRRSIAEVTDDRHTRAGQRRRASCRSGVDALARDGAVTEYLDCPDAGPDRRAPLGGDQG